MKINSATVVQTGKTLLAFIGVMLMLLEEYLWTLLVALGRWVGNLSWMRDIEYRLRCLSPMGAGLALLAPVALIFPIKVIAIWLMTRGKIGTGFLVLIGAKIFGTALVARIYTLCEPALSTVHWFVRVRAWVIHAKDWAHRRLNSWSRWRLARRYLVRMRAVLTQFA